MRSSRRGPPSFLLDFLRCVVLKAVRTVPNLLLDTYNWLGFGFCLLACCGVLYRYVVYTILSLVAVIDCMAALGS
jgi:hypothetical protein